VSNGGPQRSSIFSGLLLIVLGILFLLARFHPNLGIWHLFWRFWPVLIILWGIAKLVDHMSAERAGESRPPLLTGGEAALLLLIVFVLAGMGIYTKIRAKHPDMNIDLNVFSHKSSQSEELPPKTIPAGAHVMVTTAMGNIVAHVGDGNDLRVSVTETAEATNQAAAEQLLKSLKVVIEQTHDGYSVHPLNQETDDGHVIVDFDLTLPKSISLAADSHHGDVSISGLAGAVSVTAPVLVLKLDTPAVTDATAAWTKAVVASWVVVVPSAAVGAVGAPLNAGPANNAPPAAEMSLPRSWTVPARPLKVPTATAATSAAVRSTAPVRPLKLETPPATAATAALTNAHVASWVELVPGVAVGAIGTPVKAGEANSAPPTLVTSAARRMTAPVRLLKLDTPVVLSVTAF